MKKSLKWILSVFYGLVMIEIIVMVSPFALYWYALYAPILTGLYHWRATAWLEAFFLPHSVITTSAVLEFLRWDAGTYCFSLGVLGFALCAAQVYSAKLFRRGVVRSWIYARIRHPQYLCLSVAGLGLLTMWPRIIVLVLYTGMLFIYYYLARFEENQMMAKYPDYAEYSQRTAMFIPGNPGGKLYRLFFGWIANRAVALAALTATAGLLVIGGALCTRHYVITHASTRASYEDRTLAIAVWPMPSDELGAVVGTALRNEEVRSALAKEPGAVFVAHVLPADYGMVEMFADVHPSHQMFEGFSPFFFKHLGGLVLPFLRPHHRNRVMGTPQDNYQIVLSRVDGPDQRPIAFSGITGLEAKMTPVAIAHVSGTQPSVQKVIIPARQSLWGNIAMPMF
jgi:protein-S-isoprenylcysteine O-methyltransferase Ste14